MDKWKYCVCLHGKNEHYLDFGVRDVLNTITHMDFSKFVWGIDHFEGVEKKGREKNEKSLFNVVSSEKDGCVIVDWESFSDLIDDIYQTVNGRFSAFVEHKDAADEESITLSDALLIVFVDSTLCYVYSHDIRILKDITDKIYPFTFQNTDYLNKNGYEDYWRLNYIKPEYSLEIPIPHQHIYHEIDDSGHKYKGKAVKVDDVEYANVLGNEVHYK